MRKLLKRFRLDTSGAVTADWVVLTAGIVVLGVGAASVVFDGTLNLGDRVGDQLSSQQPTTENSFGGVEADLTSTTN